MLEPDSKPTVKLPEFTTIEARVALDPDMVKLIPATLMTTSVVRVTSSDAAKTKTGASRKDNEINK